MLNAAGRACRDRLSYRSHPTAARRDAAEGSTISVAEGGEIALLTSDRRSKRKRVRGAERLIAGS